MLSEMYVLVFVVHLRLARALVEVASSTKNAPISPIEYIANISSSTPS